MSKKPVFQYFTNTAGNSNPNPSPTNAVRTVSSGMIIADQFNNRVIIINNSKQIVFQYGTTNKSGIGQNQLYAPYTAYMIGDYTGQTPPPPTFQ